MSGAEILRDTGTGDIHVYPLGDLREHVLTPLCWCRPRRDEDDREIVVHKSMDGREAFERGDRKAS